MPEEFNFIKSLKEKSLPIRRKIKEAISLPADRDIHEYEKYLGLYRKFFDEMIRTLKPGGKGYIFPSYRSKFIEEKDSELLPEDKVSYEFQSVPGEKFLSRLVLTKKPLVSLQGYLSKGK